MKVKIHRMLMVTHAVENNRAGKEESEGWVVEIGWLGKASFDERIFELRPDGSGRRLPCGSGAEAPAELARRPVS